ncbi:MAG: hypothetical protein U0169_17720 [Polyangiaceae bacterium]
MSTRSSQAVSFFRSSTHAPWRTVSGVRKLWSCAKSAMSAEVGALPKKNGVVFAATTASS